MAEEKKERKIVVGTVPLPKEKPKAIPDKKEKNTLSENDARNAYSYKVVDKISNTVIATDFYTFCKCGILTLKSHPLYIKDAEVDLEFTITPKKK